MEISPNTKKYFTKQLTNWHANENDRSLPWKSEKDPYKIWLSEIILQQTRALQGLPYYLRFTEQYPTVNDLAAADDEQAFRLWQGLGYYNRCKNMLATARLVVDEFGGTFPDTYEGLLGLKGIGPYTASAIGSFAYGLPQAVVDGNVYRVLSRYFGIDTPFDTTDGKKQFTSLAGELLDKSDSAAYNQAIMDLGATVCTPRNPDCDNCPLRKKCIAREQDLIEILPVKSKKQAVQKRFFHYLLLHWNKQLWVRKRTGNDIWQNLHEPYLIEHNTPLNADQIAKYNVLKINKIPKSSIRYTGEQTQRLTHRIIESRFFTIDFRHEPTLDITDGKWLEMSALKKTAFPRTVVSFLEKNLYF